jgi:hypothetical protein
MSSVLFPVEIKGAGTGEIESLPSYIHRISIHHGVNVGQLFLMIGFVRYPIKRLAKDLDDYHTIYCRPEEIVVKGKNSKKLSELIFDSTSIKLDKSIFGGLDGFVGGAANEIVKGFCWCPECISEMKALEVDPYFKLIWHLKSLTFCHLHRTPLVHRCTFCGCDQVAYRKTADLGTCQKCGISLGIRKNLLKHTDIANSWEAAGFDLIELVNDFVRMEDGELPANGPFQSILDIHEYYEEIGNQNYFNSIISNDLLMCLLYRHKPISLLVARRIAYGFGVPLFAFIAGDAKKFIAVLKLGNECQLLSGYLQSKRKERKDHSLILKKITDYIDSSDKPFSIVQLSSAVGVSKGYLEYRFPELCVNLIKARKYYVQEQKLKNIYYAQSFALDYFYSEKYELHRKSRKEAYRVLRNKTNLPKFVLRKAIEIAYLSMYEKKPLL